jgi:NADH:ubiquinone oxidoreductase subunit F (NADH-binding)
MIFEIAGSVNRPGRYEMDRGAPFSRLLDEKAQGVLGGLALKALLPLGAASPALDAAEALSVELDEDSFARLGSCLNDGRLVVVSEGDSMIDLVSRRLNDFGLACCRRVASCREAVRLMRSISGRMSCRGGGAKDAGSLLDAAFAMEGFACCPEGRGLARFVAATVTKFWTEFSGGASEVEP